MTFSAHLKHARRKHHLSQEELAARLGVTSQTVSNWECERYTPWPKQQVEILSQLLSLDYSERPRVIDRIEEG